MKRSYSEMISMLSELPDIGPNNQAGFKSSLSGRYILRVIKFVDISKPADKPVEEIEEPEDNEVAVENQLSKSNARMIQLDLKDCKDQDIKALETEKIELLSGVKPNSIITIAGPVDVRCRNIMLERKNVVSIEDPQIDEPTQLSNVANPSHQEQRHVINTVNSGRNAQHVIDAKNPIPMIDLLGQPMEFQQSTHHTSLSRQPIQVVQLEEDWDEDEEDDCIILD